jgi:hypothetical protein
VPGFKKLSFRRVVLAHIAMSAPIQTADPKRAVEEMRQRLNTYRDQGALTDLVGQLLTAAKGAVGQAPVPGADVLAPVVVEAAAKGIVARLRRARWVTRLTWNDALAWFGHLDQGLRHDPMLALVQLSRQAQIDNAAVRDDVDNLLVTALLADLRDSLARVANRRSNALILLDNGDAPETTAFVTALVRVRHNLAAQGPVADPLAVVVSSGGGLSSTVAGQVPLQLRVAESGISKLAADDVRRAGTWLAVVLGDLSLDDIQTLVNEYLWPAEIGTGDVVSAVHRLTAGHPLATTLALTDLQAAPELIDDLGKILSPPRPDSGRKFDRYLLDRIVAGLSPQRLADPQLREDLITLSAARDREEAEALTGQLRTPIRVDPRLLMSPTLWADTGVRGYPALPPFVRYLLLRRLADRAAHRVTWDKVFRLLLDQAPETDVGGQLHHMLALGETDAVAARLAELLPPTTRAQDWLTLLDHVVATPDPRRKIPTSEELGQAADSGPELTESATASVLQLVTQLHIVADPRFSNRSALHHSYLLIAHQYEQLAGPRGGQLLFINRAEKYRKLAAALA